MIRSLGRILAILIFLGLLFTGLVYLWGSSKSVHFDKEVPATDS